MTSTSQDTTNAAGPTRTVAKRRRGPFKRSRTGCGTCKRRGKKCDEIWNMDGFCQRCLAGPWECTGSSTGSRPSRSSLARSMSVISEADSPAVGPPLSAPRSGTASTPAALPILSPTLTQSGFAFSRSNSVSSPVRSSSHSSSNPSCISVAPATNSLTAVTPVDTPATSVSTSGLTPFAGLWNGYTTSSAADSRASYTTPFTQPLFDWPGASSSIPTAMLTTCADGTLAIDSTATLATQNMDSADFWTELSASFTSSSSGPTQTFNSGSRVLFLSGDRPMRQGVSLAEIYARVVESWLVGIPSTTRDYARARILALNDRNSVMRAVRYAVAAAYIFLFASDPQGDNNPKPKLVELAYRGAGIIDTVQRGQALTETESQSSNAIRKIRLYVDHVSTPFAADLESTKWTEDAVQELRQVVVTDRQQLSDLLWGVIDLQLVEFIRGGAAPSYSMLALGDRLVRSALGSDHPPITLAELRTSETFSLRLYALSDISRCIVQRGRRTIFNFWTDHKMGEEESSTTTVTDEEPWATYLGLPDSIVILLAEVVNLCAELQTSTPTSIKAQAEELEAALRGWSSTPLNTSNHVDSPALVSRTIAGELWRLSALVLLYQSVHRVGGLHPVLRRAQGEILSLLGSITQLPNGDLWGFIALPAFLAATLSISETDRKRSMQFLVRPGPERVWLDNVALIEAIWAETDETGRLVEWHDKMTREGLTVAFF